MYLFNDEVLDSSASTSYLGPTSRYTGERNGNPLQYSCLENLMDGGAWWATVHGVAKNWTRLSDFTSLHFQIYRYLGGQSIMRQFLSEGGLKAKERNLEEDFILLVISLNLVLSTTNHTEQNLLIYAVFLWTSCTLLKSRSHALAVQEVYTALKFFSCTLHPQIQPRLVRILVVARFSVHISLRKDHSVKGPFWVNHSGYGVEKRSEGSWRYQ